LKKKKKTARWNDDITTRHLFTQWQSEKKTKEKFKVVEIPVFSFYSFTIFLCD
jgi:hypothetical protein